MLADVLLVYSGVQLHVWSGGGVHTETDQSRLPCAECGAVHMRSTRMRVLPLRYRRMLRGIPHLASWRA